MGADTPELLVGTLEGGLYLDLLGRATQRTCPTADQLVSDYLATCPQQPLIVLDLDECEWVDSTFAGWLVGLSRRVGRTAGGRVCLTGCSDRCRGSLEKMQLTSLFQFETVAAPAETRRVACITGDRPTREELKLMLEAHEVLAGLGSQNEQTFAPIVATLRDQIDSA